jgi:hypothetical protein
VGGKSVSDFLYWFILIQQKTDMRIRPSQTCLVRTLATFRAASSDGQTGMIECDVFVGYLTTVLVSQIVYSRMVGMIDA